MTRYLSTVEKYNPERGRWSKLSGLSLPRRSPGVVAYRDRLYVVGGMGEKEDLSTGEIFCPSSNEWTKMNKPMSEVNGWCSACLGEIQSVFLTHRQMGLFEAFVKIHPDMKLKDSNISTILNGALSVV